MWPIIAWIVMVLALAGIILFAAPLYEAIVPLVAQDPSVQALGWGSIPANIEHAVLAYAPRIALIGTFTIGVMWYLRRELLTSRVR